MKEATGELSTTVITVIAIAAVAGLFYAFVWPTIQRTIVNNTCKAMGNYEVSTTKGTNCVEASGYENAGNGGTAKYYCCPKTTN